MSSDIKIKFSDKLVDILKVLEENDNYIAFEMLYLKEPESRYFNGLKITDIDVGKNFTFLVTIDGKQTYMKIGKFIRYFFKGLFSDKEITKFSYAYNKVKNGGDLEPEGRRINVADFVYQPNNPRSTFLSMVTKTYPHGHEEEVLQFLPDLEKDKFGNYYKIIGSNPTTMFTSHLDTADRKQKITRLYTTEDENGDEIIFTDGSSVLGADDKAGVTVMLYMMHHKVPGLYYFFIGEERGGIGSNALSSEYDSFDYLKNIKKCISFDRRKTGSVITQQLGRECCSNEFATALCEQYSKSGDINLTLDPTGIYTDSASFLDDISECTNVSVGYDNEHTGDELQNMTFLTKLCEASVKVDWDSLPAVRKVGLSEELVKKHKNLINDIKRGAFALEVKLIGYDDFVFIRIDLDQSDVDSAYDSLVSVQTILDKHKVSDDLYIHDSYLKILLR